MKTWNLNWNLKEEEKQEGSVIPKPGFYNMDLGFLILDWVYSGILDWVCKNPGSVYIRILDP